MWVISGDVVASQRTRVYRVRVVFNQRTGKVMNKPAGSCECVAHLGWCSHQLSLGFLSTNFLKLFPRGTTCDEFRRVYPPSVFNAQREGCPWSYAVGSTTAKRIECFDKLKWERGKPPKSARDTAQLLVPRVKAWQERWLVDASEPEKHHAFARKELQKAREAELQTFPR